MIRPRVLRAPNLITFGASIFLGILFAISTMNYKGVTTTISMWTFGVDNHTKNYIEWLDAKNMHQVKRDEVRRVNLLLMDLKITIKIN